MIQFPCTVHGNPGAHHVEQNNSTWHITEDNCGFGNHLYPWIKGNFTNRLSKGKIILSIINENYLFIFYMWISSSKVKSNDNPPLGDVDVTHLPFTGYFKGKIGLLFEKYPPNELIHLHSKRELDGIALWTKKYMNSLY